MTKREKEEQRKKMMWVAMWAIIGVMIAILGLAWFEKPLADMATIAGAFFVALAGVNGAIFFSKPGQGADDEYN